MDLRHVLCGVLLVSRVGDVATTYLITPTLELEANPIVRKLGWRFALLTLLLCLVPYFSMEIAAAMTMPFLLVSASNASKVWLTRVMGEKAQMEMLVSLARRSKRSHALLGVGASCGFIFLAGGVVLLFYPEPEAGMAFWLALGIVTYGLAIWIWGSLFAIRLFRKAATAA
jgi:hypothetical protein